MTTRPSCNPDVPHPGKLFFAGCWRTPEAVDRAVGRRVYRLHKKTTCERCGFVPEVESQLDVHHIDGSSSNNAISNLLTLCSNCHRLVEWQLRAMAGKEAHDNT